MPKDVVLLKLVRNCKKLEIWYVRTHIYLVSENIPFSTKTALFLLMSAFGMSGCVRHFLVPLSVFVK